MQHIIFECKETGNITWKTEQGQLSIHDLIKIPSALEKIMKENEDLKKRIKHIEDNCCNITPCSDPACPHSEYNQSDGPMYGPGYC